MEVNMRYDCGFEKGNFSITWTQEYMEKENN